TEFPVTLIKFAHEGGQPEPADDIELLLDAEDVKVFPGYEKGHTVTVTGYKEKSPGSTAWEEETLGTWWMTGDELSLRLNNIGQQRLISVRVRIDTEVKPGLYNDFVLLRL